MVLGGFLVGIVLHMLWGALWYSNLAFGPLHQRLAHVGISRLVVQCGDVDGTAMRLRVCAIERRQCADAAAQLYDGLMRNPRSALRLRAHCTGR